MALRVLTRAAWSCAATWAVVLALLVTSIPPVDASPPLGAKDFRSLAPAAPVSEEEPEAVIPQVATDDRVARRTRYSLTTRNDDGTLTTAFGVRPLHAYDRATKEFKPFRNDLGPATTPGYLRESRGNGYVASFERPGDVSSGRPVMRMAIDDRAITMTAVGARPAGASVGGSTLTYDDAYPGGADLIYQVHNERIKETVRIPRAPQSAAEGRFAFELELDGLAATKGTDDSILFADPQGEPVFLMPAPFIADSSGDPERGYSGDIAVTLTELSPGKLRLELSPSLEWMASPERVMPLLLDPTVEDVTYSPVGDSAQNATIYEAAPGRVDPGTALGNNQLYVGRRPDDGLRRNTLIRFPELDTLPTDSQVVGATMKLYARTGPTNGLDVQAQRNLGAWDDASVTWSNAPGYEDNPWRSEGGVPGWYSFYQNGVVRQAVQRVWGNHGVRISAPGALVGQTVGFDSSYGQYPPRLEVRYVPATRHGVSAQWSYTAYDHGADNASFINLSSGNVVFQHTDGASLAGGSGTGLTHTYNSQDLYGQTDLYDDAGAVYGEGWTFSHNLRLYPAGDQNAMVFKDGTGANYVYAFFKDEAGTRSYFSPLGSKYTLTKDIRSTAVGSRTYKLVDDPGNIIHYFASSGVLTRTEYPREDDFLSYSYDLQGRLTTIVNSTTGNQVTLEYNGPGTPGRLSKITDMGGRVSTYVYSSYGNLKTIKHGVGTANEITTTLGYSMGHHLLSVTDAQGKTSYINYRSEIGWDDPAKSVDGFGPFGSATSVSRSTERIYREEGALRIDIGNLASGGTARASKTLSTPLVWNAVQQEIVGYVWVPVGANLQARLMLRDGRGQLVYGPWWAVEPGQWNLIRLPYANVDPSYKIARVGVDFTVPSGVAAYTGPVWVDHFMVRGVAASWTDSQPTPATVGELTYDWPNRKTSRTSSALTYAHGYDVHGTAVDIRGSFGHVGSLVDFASQSTATRVAVQIDVNGKRINVAQDTGTQDMTLAPHDQVLTVEDVEALAALGAQIEGSPIEHAPPITEHLLDRSITYYAEAPMETILPDRQASVDAESATHEEAEYTVLTSDQSVAENCAEAEASYITASGLCQVGSDDGLRYVSCRRHSGYIGHDARTHCFNAYYRALGPCSSGCRGRCGHKCGILHQYGTYTKDCADHDHCVDEHPYNTGPFGARHPSCGDEWHDAEVDWFLPANCARCGVRQPVVIY